MSIDTKKRHLALLGVGVNYGAAVAKMFGNELGSALTISNRNLPIVKELSESFPRVFLSNADAMEGARFVGLLPRPGQVKALLDEIGLSLTQGQVVVNFTAASWDMSLPLIHVAVWPPIGCRTPAAFFTCNEAVNAESKSDFLGLLKSVSDQVFEVHDCQAQLGLMARTIVHTCTYLAELMLQGYDERHITAHFQSIAMLLGGSTASQIVGDAATAGGMSGKLHKYLHETGMMTTITKSEEIIAYEFAEENTYKLST